MEGSPQPPKPPAPTPPPGKSPPAQPGKPPPAQPGKVPPAMRDPRSVDPHERIDGLSSRLARVERRLGIRTYIGAALAGLALAAGGSGIYLALETRDDAATNADIEDLREEVTGVRETAAEAAQEDVRSINQTLSDVEDQIRSLQNRQRRANAELSVAQDDIRDLRDQISELETDSGGGGQGGQ